MLINNKNTMEGKDIQIPLKGIVRNTPITEGVDGEMEELVNLRFKDGAMRPISSPEVYADVTGYTNLYFHSNAGYNHILGVTNDKLYYIANEIDTVYTKLTTPVYIMDVSGVLSYTQIGNIINIIDGDVLKYILWSDNAYIIFDTNIAVPRVYLRVDAYENYRCVNNEGTNDADSIKGIVAKTFAYEKKYGRINGSILACTALELYDGSYILHSNPILLGQAYDKDTRTFVNDDNAPFIYGALENGDIIENDYIQIKNEGDSLIAYQSTVTKDGTTTIHDGAELNYSCYHYSTPDRNICIVGANKLQFKILYQINDDYINLIKSISIFISKEIDFYDKNNCVNIGGGVYLLKPKSNTDIIKEIEANQQFYKVHEITFDELQNTAINTWINIDLKGKLGDNLVTNELLPIDNFTHHTLKPHGQFINNSKLHIFDYKQELFQGWDYVNFLNNAGAGQFYYEAEKEVKIWNYYIIVSIKTDSGIEKVAHKYDGSSEMIERLYFNPMLSYPDSRATKIEISIKAKNSPLPTNASYKYEFKLKASETQNYAYYISPDLKPILNASNINMYDFVQIIEEFKTEEIRKNVFRASQVNNPFVFPVAQTYTVGNGTIVGLASNAIALSTGQFGEYPVYVLCSDGIYAMYVGGADITYKSEKPVAMDVCNNQKSIKTIDGGVIFSTDRGLMLIAGSEVTELSIPIEGNPLTFNDATKNEFIDMFTQAINHSQLVQLNSVVVGDEFKQFLGNAIIGYNFNEREIWITVPGKFTYSLKQGVWSKINITGTEYVKDYPKEYLLNNGKLYDLGKETKNDAEVMFLTRPIKFGTHGFKQAMRAVLRCRLQTNPQEITYQFAYNNFICEKVNANYQYVYNGFVCEKEYVEKQNNVISAQVEDLMINVFSTYPVTSSIVVTVQFVTAGNTHQVPMNMEIGQSSIWLEINEPCQDLQILEILPTEDTNYYYIQ